MAPLPRPSPDWPRRKAHTLGSTLLGTCAGALSWFLLPLVFRGAGLGGSWQFPEPRGRVARRSSFLEFGGGTTIWGGTWGGDGRVQLVRQALAGYLVAPPADDSPMQSRHQKTPWPWQWGGRLPLDTQGFMPRATEAGAALASTGCRLAHSRPLATPLACGGTTVVRGLRLWASRIT